MLKVIIKSLAISLIIVVLSSLLFHQYFSYKTQKYASREAHIKASTEAQNNVDHTCIDFPTPQAASDPEGGMGATISMLYKEYYKEYYDKYYKDLSKEYYDKYFNKPFVYVVSFNILLLFIIFTVFLIRYKKHFNDRHT